jgi:hypothetical protein
MIFINDTHKTNYEELIVLSRPCIDTAERVALFYILAGNKDLFKKKFSIYDFKRNVTKFHNFKHAKVDFCSSSKALIRLGFNLYNGYSDKYTNPLILLGILDTENYNLAINAIKIRFEYF